QYKLRWTGNADYLLGVSDYFNMMTMLVIFTSNVYILRICFFTIRQMQVNFGSDSAPHLMIL
ncbi:putative membrane protein (partial), partial [Candidatus Ichthyocystis hellenicum]